VQLDTDGLPVPAYLDPIPVGKTSEDMRPMCKDRKQIANSDFQCSLPQVTELSASTECEMFSPEELNVQETNCMYYLPYA